MEHHRLHSLSGLRIHQSTIYSFVVKGHHQYSRGIRLSFRLGNNRKNLNTYQEATWALGVYGYNCTDKEIAAKLNMNAGNLSKIKKLNNILVNYNSPAKASEYLSKLNSGSIGYTVALQELNNAENIDNIIAVLDGKYGDVAKKIGLDKAKTFKTEMEAKYFETKYDKKSLKALNEDIDRVVHPELYEKVEKGYHSDVQPIVKKAQCTRREI